MSLFNLDIPGIINGAMGPLMLDGILTKVIRGSRTQGFLTEGPGDIQTDLTFKGFTEEYRDGVIDGALIQEGDRKVMVLTDSLPSLSPPAKPEVGDDITMEGETRNIINVKRDPAGATYTCQVR